MRRTAIHWKTVIDDTTLEGDKSLNEEHRRRCAYRTKQHLERHGGDVSVPDHYDPNRPVNFRRGTCPWCGNGQAQITILQADPHYKHSWAGEVRRSIDGVANVWAMPRPVSA